MSNYMFMLESHLSADQSRVVADVQTAASDAGVNVFLTGGALRDMLAGFPILDIDFTVEGDGVKLARTVRNAKLLNFDETAKSAQLLFSNGTRATIGMARQEKYPKPGSKPQLRAGSIHEDLRGRDFTVNSIALSLSAASRGLLLDPNNGVGDIERKELRAVTNYTLYNDPIRLLRLHRFKMRLGFEIGERTLAQYANAREAGLETLIPAAALLDELRKIACEQHVAEVVQVLNEEKLLGLYSPAFSGAKLNLSGLQKLQRVKQMIPHGTDLQLDNFSVFLNVLAENLTQGEKGSFSNAIGLDKVDIENWQKLEARSKKLEKELNAAGLQKPSQLYNLLVKAHGDHILYLLLHSSERLVQDRIKNYLHKYLPAAQEVTEREVLAINAEPGTRKYEKAKAGLIAARLDARPKKVVPPSVEEAPAPPPVQAFARRQ